MSPCQLNPLDFNPLRDILASELDFEPVRRCHKLRLCVSATHARTGQLRKFRQSELSAEVVMAPACLPQVFRAFKIELHEPASEPKNGDSSGKRPNCSG